MFTFFYFQNSTRDALHQRRSSSDLSAHPNSSIVGTGASSGRSASISVTTGLYNRGSSNTTTAASEVDGRGVTQLPVPTITETTSIKRNNPMPSIPSTDEKDSEIKELVENCHKWNFDIIELERITDSKCLGMY